jgi:hypothetical protein
MKRHIALIIGLFTINSIQSMENINEQNRYEHMRLSQQAAQLIRSDVDETTVAKWKDLLKEAKEFDKANPKFPYLLLARRPGQGPDARSITNAAPVVIDFLQGKCLEQQKLKKLRYSLGDQYILKLIATSGG